MKLSCKMLQNLPYFWSTTKPKWIFSFFFNSSIHDNPNFFTYVYRIKKLIYISVNSQKNPQSLNGKLTGSLEGLSKRQKKRLNRRLSKSKENTPEKYIIPSIPENVLMDR